MNDYKYRIGQRVNYRPLGAGAGGAGPFKIERRLPSESIEHQYRIESLRDGHQRVVREGELQTIAPDRG